MTEQTSNFQSGKTRDNMVSRVAITAGVLFSIPLVAMLFTGEVNWGPADFVAWGLLLFVASSAFLLVTKQLPRSRWWVAGTVIAVIFVYIWAELAVGVFTNLGS